MNRIKTDKKGKQNTIIFWRIFSSACSFTLLTNHWHLYNIHVDRIKHMCIHPIPVYLPFCFRLFTFFFNFYLFLSIRLLSAQSFPPWNLFPLFFALRQGGVCYKNELFQKNWHFLGEMKHEKAWNEHSSKKRNSYSYGWSKHYLLVMTQVIYTTSVIIG